MFFNIALKTNINWPTNETAVSWRGRTILLRPATTNYAPDVLLEYDESTMTALDAHRFLREFLSAYVWIARQRAKAFCAGGGPMALRVGPGPLLQNIATEPFKLEYLPDWTDERSGLALALYREALNASASPHRFLSFWKILSTKNPDGARGPQRDWLIETFKKIIDAEGSKRLDELRGAGNTDEEIAHRLYVSGRCAVAHAHSDPIVNPDDPTDESTLEKEMPLVRALAEYLIEHEYGIESESAYLARHGKAALPANSDSLVRMFWIPNIAEYQATP